MAKFYVGPERAFADGIYYYEGDIIELPDHPTWTRLSDEEAAVMDSDETPPVPEEEETAEGKGAFGRKKRSSDRGIL